MTVWDKGEWKMEENNTNENVETTENTQENEQENTTFTRSDVDREVSKAVQSALDKREAKHKEEMQKAIEDAIAERERLSKLSEKEREEEQLTKREQELLDRERAIERAELKADAIADLTSKGLSVEFADILLADDAEGTLSNINVFKEKFDNAVNEAVKEKLRQDTPQSGVVGIKGKQESIANIASEKRLI